MDDRTISQLRGQYLPDTMRGSIAEHRWNLLKDPVTIYKIIYEGGFPDLREERLETAFEHIRTELKKTSQGKLE